MITKKQISEFPKFTKIKPSMKSEYEEWFSQFSPYSDFSFNNLISWLDIKDTLYISRHGGNMVFLLDNPFNKHKNTYSVLGKSKIDQTFKALREQGIRKLEMVPEETIANIHNPDSLVITENPNDSDYVYKFNDWINWRESLNKSTKSNIGKLSRNMDKESIEIVPVDLRKDEGNNLVRHYSNVWEVKNSETKIAKIQLEHTAIKRLLDHANTLNVKALVIQAKGKPISLMIYHQPPQNNFIIFNHLKCDYSYSGIFDFTFMLSVKFIHNQEPKRYKYFNAEQDLGIEGLRHHKKLMCPAYKLKRYTVKL